MSKQNNISRKLALDSPERKPSVFERLGTKSSASSGKNVCQSWAQNGTCPLNKTCKYAHTHVLISPSKRSKAEAMKKQSIVVQKRTGKEEHKKSRSHQCGEAEWEGWELGDLEDADEKVLERRKQELQRALQLQLKKEKELTRKKDKRTDKKRASSSSSSTTTTTETSSSTTSSSSSSSEARKRQSRKRKHSSSSSETDVSTHRPRKSPKTVKVKVSNSKKSIDKKESKNSGEARSKSVVVAKKSGTQKKSASPSWEKSRARTPHSKQQSSKKASPHQSPSDSKNRSPSPRYDRSMTKSKNRTSSPKVKAKESSPKRSAKKVKESSAHTKEKMRQSPVKSRSSPSRVHKVSPSRSRRHEDNSEKRRGHYDDRKHSPRRDRSREKERKREARRGHSNENDNGGLKKGGKILPLKPSSYTKDSTLKPKESSRRKSAEKNSDIKTKEVECDKDKNRTDREKERNEKDKSKSERDKLKHKKGSETYDRHSARDRESDRSSLRSRDDRGRDREAERVRLAKEREAERQKERDEALERCRERQRERERMEKERKEKEDKKHQRDGNDSKQKDGDRELPSLLDLKTENPRSHNDSCNSSKNADKHSQRDSRRSDKGSEKGLNQEREGRDRERLSQRSQGSPQDKDHDRREPRRADDNERRQSDKDYDTRRNRESDARHIPDIRRPGALGRRPLDDPDCRRPWDDLRRVMDGPHDRRRLLEASLDDRRPHPMLRRVDDQYDYRRGRDDPDLDVRDFPPDDRRGRKLLHPFHHDSQDWEAKAQELEYREAELRDEWNHADRHHDWAVRYDHKWLDREEPRDSLWNHYARRPPHDDWNNDWVPDDQPPRSLYREPNDDQLEMLNDGFPDHNARRHNEVDHPHVESGKELPNSGQGDPSRWEKNAKPEGDALSDISDDPDDILNQDDEGNESSAAATTATTSTTTAVTNTTPASDAANNQSSISANDSNNNQNNATGSSSGTGNVQNSNPQISVRNNDFFFDPRRPILERFGERALDFEEISDEELEEEARANKGIMDVLGADWAGLIKDVRSRAKRQEGPVVAPRRWMIDKLISSIGISVKYAGQEFTDYIIDKYKEMKPVKEAVKEPEPQPDAELESNQEVKDVKEKVEIKEENNAAGSLNEENISVNVTVKLEPEEMNSSPDDKPEVGINLYHDVPALHNYIRECKNYRSSLFIAHNRFKRALSARTDLSLRRELCNLPPREPLHFTSPLDNKMYENSIKLFQRA